MNRYCTLKNKGYIKTKKKKLLHLPFLEIFGKGLAFALSLWLPVLWLDELSSSSSSSETLNNKPYEFHYKTQKKKKKTIKIYQFNDPN